LSLPGDNQAAARLISALTDLTKHAGTLPRARQVELPSAAELELEPAMLPREAFFARRKPSPPARPRAVPKYLVTTLGKPAAGQSSLPVPQLMTLTFSAWGPFWPCVMSNSTCCPSSKLR
jgi:hypothetical protein